MLKLSPAFKDYLWGGTKLKEQYRKVSPLEIVAESWELSTHPDGESTIVEGKEGWIGKPLSAYLKQYGKKALGTKSRTENELPILIKFIDAMDKLSIQVHPEDDYAIHNENDLGKTEMWYIVEAEEDSELIYGFSKTLTKETFQKHIEDNTILEVANRVKVRPGDVFFITPGTMHAIGAGIVIAEIQESSNVTYRISDYGRLGQDGKLRELHIEKALEVTNLEATTTQKVSYELTDYTDYHRGTLVECEYFNTELVTLTGEMTSETSAESFHSILVLEGEMEVNGKEVAIKLDKGDSLFIPANTGKYTLKGKATCIFTKL